jgi:hypothetical protein
MNNEQPIKSVIDAEIRTAPTPFVYCENFLADPDFKLLRSAMPPVGEMVRYEPPHQFRYYYNLDRAGIDALPQDRREIWRETANLFRGPHLVATLHEKFADLIQIQTTHRAKLIEKVSEPEGVVETPRLMITSDCQDFLLKPHTDSGPKVVTLLYYLAGDNDPEDWGTEFYAPIDPSFRSFPSEHLDPSQFVVRAKAPYRPNAAVAFVKTDASFHGVYARGLDGRRRNMIVLNLELGRRSDFDVSTHVKRDYFFATAFAS